LASWTRAPASGPRRRCRSRDCLLDREQQPVGGQQSAGPCQGAVGDGCPRRGTSGRRSPRARPAERAVARPGRCAAASRGQAWSATELVPVVQPGDPSDELSPFLPLVLGVHIVPFAQRRRPRSRQRRLPVVLPVTVSPRLRRISCGFRVVVLTRRRPGPESSGPAGRAVPAGGIPPPPVVAVRSGLLRGPRDAGARRVMASVPFPGELCTLRKP
jgi:hypothetical protein